MDAEGIFIVGPPVNQQAFDVRKQGLQEEDKNLRAGITTEYFQCCYGCTKVAKEVANFISSVEFPETPTRNRESGHISEELENFWVYLLNSAFNGKLLYERKCFIGLLSRRRSIIGFGGVGLLNMRRNTSHIATAQADLMKYVALRSSAPHFGQCGEPFERLDAVGRVNLVNYVVDELLR